MMLPTPLPADPLRLFQDWYDTAQTRKATDNPNAFVLTTVDMTATTPRPDARVVLCKGMDLNAGYISFYTNYASRKGRQLAVNAKVTAVFHWDNAEQQVRLDGTAVRAPAEQSDAYFASRHPGSRVGAWASAQSQPLDDRATLTERVRAEADRFGVPMGDDLQADNVDVDIPRPPHWGGFNLWISAVELWCGGSHRVHDRARFERELVIVEGNPTPRGDWHATRLNP